MNSSPYLSLSNCHALTYPLSGDIRVHPWITRAASPVHNCMRRANLELGSLIVLPTLSSNALIKMWYCIGSPLNVGRSTLGAWSTSISAARLLAVLSSVPLAQVVSRAGPMSLPVPTHLGISYCGLRGRRLAERVDDVSAYVSCTWVLGCLSKSSSL